MDRELVSVAPRAVQLAYESARHAGSQNEGVRGFLHVVRIAQGRHCTCLKVLLALLKVLRTAAPLATECSSY